MNNLFNPEQLKAAIAFSGKKKAEIASYLGVSPITFSKYLMGIVVPPDERIQQLVHYLGLPQEWYFLTSLENNYQPEGFAFRAKVSTSKHEKLHNETIRNILSRGVSYFCTFIQPPKLNLHQAPSYELLRRKNPQGVLEYIEQEALALRDLWNLKRLPALDLTAHAEVNGVWCSRIQGMDKVDAFSCWVMPLNIPLVLLNSDKSAVRTRFDLAHELGHLVLHRDLDWRLYHSDSVYRKQIEAEADCFASNFLLPRETFLQDIRTRKPTLIDLKQLKKKWQVSIACMIKRLQDLDAIDNAEYLFTRLSILGWRKAEPLDYDEHAFSYEPVGLFNKITKLLLEHDKMTPYDLTQHLGLDVDLFCHYFSVDNKLFKTSKIDLNNVIQFKTI